MLKFVLLSCLLAAALAMPHHTPTHQHDAVEAKPAAAETPAKPLESEKPAEAKPEENKEAEAVKPEAAKPADAVKAEASSDTVRKEETVVKETPVVPAVPVVPVEHAAEHHAAEPKPVKS